jgi:D-alanyl-D-alanine carboxypeptidase
VKTKQFGLRLILSAFFFISNLPARAEQPSLPDTNVGRVAEKLLAALNSPTPAEIEKFVSESISDEPWNRMTREKFRTLFGKVREQSGDLRVDRIFMADERNLRIRVASAKADKKVGLEIVLPSKDSTQACHVWIHHFPSRGPTSLPKQPMDAEHQRGAIENYLDEAARLGLHSGAVLVAKGDTVMLHKAWGYAHAPSKKPNLLKMQYGTASVGKMFTAVAIAQLQQAGKLQYSDTISKYLPDYPDKEAARKVQIRHLLAHTAGLGDPFDSPKLANSKNYVRQSDWFETFANKPLAFEPGDHHEYSNGGYIVLAAIVEQTSGLLFRDYLQKHIFEPAGMNNTGLGSEKLPCSVPHAVTIMDDPLGLNGPQPKSEEKMPEDGVGMGGWTSTAEDLFKFARALRTAKLLTPENTQEITTGKVAFIPPPMNIKYCYGFYEMPVGKNRMVGHSGGGGDSGVGAEVEILWETEHTIIVLSNQGVEEARRTTHDIARFLSRQEEHGAETPDLSNKGQASATAL